MKLARQPPGPRGSGSRSSRDLDDHGERILPPGSAWLAAAARAVTRATTAAAISSADGLPVTMLSTGAAAGSGRAAGPAPAGSLSPGLLPGDGGISVPRLSDADAELAVHPRPERVPQPLPGLLVGPQRQAEFLLGVDQQFLVDHGGQDRAGQQVADVVLAAGQDPLLRHVLARFLHPLPLGAEPGRGRRRDRAGPDRRPRYVPVTEH